MDFEKFTRFLEKKSDRDIGSSDLQEMIQWIHSDEAKEVIGNKMLVNTDQSETDLDYEEVYSEILDKIKKNDNSNGFAREVRLQHSQSDKSYKIRNYLMVAASVAILIVSAYLLVLSVDRVPADEVTSEIISPVVKQALKGEKLNIQLNDGTKIKLNSGSSLSYYPDSFENDRHVTLIGEAYFEVFHDETRPFKVSVENGFEVKVLGTSFIVNAADDNRNIVAVKTGKVLVQKSNNEQSILLTKNELTKVSEFQALDRNLISNNDLYFGWIDNKLVLEDASFIEVLNTINNWYGYKINVTLDFSNFDEYSASLTNPTLKEVMESLSHSYKFNYQINEELKTIEIQ